MSVASDYKAIADTANNYSAWLTATITSALSMLQARANDGSYREELFLNMFRLIDFTNQKPMTDLFSALTSRGFTVKNIDSGGLLVTWDNPVP